MATLDQLKAWSADLDRLGEQLAAAQRAGAVCPNLVLVQAAVARGRYFLAAEIAGTQAEATLVLNAPISPIS